MRSFTKKNIAKETNLLALIYNSQYVDNRDHFTELLARLRTFSSYESLKISSILGGIAVDGDYTNETKSKLIRESKRASSSKHALIVIFSELGKAGEDVAEYITNHSFNDSIFQMNEHINGRGNIDQLGGRQNNFNKRIVFKIFGELVKVFDPKKEHDNVVLNPLYTEAEINAATEVSVRLVEAQKYLNHILLDYLSDPVITAFKSLNHQYITDFTQLHSTPPEYFPGIDWNALQGVLNGIDQGKEDIIKKLDELHKDSSLTLPENVRKGASWLLSLKDVLYRLATRINYRESTEYDAITKKPTNGADYTDTKPHLIPLEGLYCAYCETAISDGLNVDIEHKIPKSKFPNQEKLWENLVISCKSCNEHPKSDYYIRSDDHGATTQKVKADVTIDGHYDAHLNRARNSVAWPDLKFTAAGYSTVSFEMFRYPIFVEGREKEITVDALTSNSSIYVDRFYTPRFINFKDIDEDAAFHNHVASTIWPSTLAQKDALKSGATNMIDICYLNHQNNEVNKDFNDQRVIRRTKAWFHAMSQIKALAEFAKETLTLKEYYKNELDPVIIKAGEYETPENKRQKTAIDALKKDGDVVKEWKKRREELNKKLDNIQTLAQSYLWRNTLNMVKDGGFYSTWVRTFESHFKSSSDRFDISLVLDLDTESFSKPGDPFQFHGTDVYKIIEILRKEDENKMNS